MYYNIVKKSFTYKLYYLIVSQVIGFQSGASVLVGRNKKASLMLPVAGRWKTPVLITAWLKMFASVPGGGGVQPIKRSSNIHSRCMRHLLILV